MADNYNHVPLALAKQFETLASIRGVSKVARGEATSTESTGGFFQVAKRVGGSKEKLMKMPIKKGSDQTWWTRRNNFCKRHRGQMLVKRENVVEKDGPYKGTPTRRELGMIMWMCSNISEKDLEKMLPLVKKITKE